ncbi:TPA: hypothetical protein I1694_001908 [Staphylococcus pseudintermedius]|uniref:MFS transporter n=1 Tax=Staphylococcus pseudintermedius TaxID=283734 RepID=A0A317YQH0_STAPS|nr:hypothetical protein [Staphylococcus pseudintermedius]EGQ0293833.1 hypothetical protein [Staphylococcus pseudintermedius]EGQ0298628.1 hypothetical protein [Staphylococcus pseudintermedius]EGQ0300998.1 hypothetical protein [Staphylococcus pseudintermedius]EGQ0303252.1 hypothetical protein [Staphylococcus pseudintermedius]
MGLTTSILASYITGYLTDVTGSKAISFYLAAFLLLASFSVSLLLTEQRKSTHAQSS